MHRLIAFLIPVLILPALVLAQDSRTVSGQVSYLDRMALPEDAVLLVEVLGTDGRLQTEARLPTRGQQVPVPFAVAVNTTADVILRAGVMLDQNLVWLGDPVMAASDAAVELLLRRYQPMGFSTTFRCGDLLVQTGFAGDALIMDTGAARMTLQPVPAASGAKYAVQDTPDTSFWNRGDAALVTLEGTTLPECRVSLPAAQTPYTARGNEPFWNATVADGTLLLARLGMEDDLRLTVADASLRDDGAITVTATDSARALRAVLVRENVICRDTMTGVPYPETVSLSLGDETITGCGGAAAGLLTQRTWVVTRFAGAEVMSGTRVTLGFDTTGRVAGSSGCNRWFAGYDLTGESLTIRQSGATMMACPEHYMAQERAFITALTQVRGFDIDDTGALLLLGSDGPVITATVARDGSAP